PGRGRGDRARPHRPRPDGHPPVGGLLRHPVRAPGRGGPGGGQGLPARRNGGARLAPEGPCDPRAAVPPLRRQGQPPGPLPRDPARSLRRGPWRRRGGHARRGRDLPGEHDHGEALGGVPGAARRPGRVPGSLADPPGGRCPGVERHEPTDAVTIRTRWLLPVAALPFVGLLAYGFWSDPRAIPSPLVGRPAPPFRLAAFDGTPVSLDALRGQVLVLNFWASWCYPACYEEAPVLEAAWRAYRERGVAV